MYFCAPCSSSKYRLTQSSISRESKVSLLPHESDGIKLSQVFYTYSDIRIIEERNQIQSSERKKQDKNEKIKKKKKKANHMEKVRHYKSQ